MSDLLDRFHAACHEHGLTLFQAAYAFIQPEAADHPTQIAVERIWRDVWGGVQLSQANTECDALCIDILETAGY